MNQSQKRWLLSFIMMFILLFAFPQFAVGSQEDFSDVPTDHWALKSIQLAAQQGIVNGYPDGTFRPDDPVKEAEFLAMLLRAYPEIELPKVNPDAEWYETYYALSSAYNWPVWYENGENQYNRGRVAQVIAATQGTRLDVESAVQFLLDQKLSTGKTSATVAGYGIKEPLRRAEAVEFIFRLKNRGYTLQEASSYVEPTYDQLHVRGIRIGDTVQHVTNTLGQPARIDSSEYGFDWYIYNQDYKQYAQIGILEDRVVALYTNGTQWATHEGITFGHRLSEVKNTYGQSLKNIRKGTTLFQFSAEQQAQSPVYEIDNSYVTFFIDEHENHTVTAVQVIDHQVEQSLQSFYGPPSADLQKSFERQMFDLANAVRARYGKHLLTWDNAVASIARSHSQDMSERDYFDHTNKSGKSPFDRMKEGGIDYGAASENIAGGSTSAIFAHEGLMNSEGHRKNILSDNVTHLGVGVFFGDGRFSFYYTQKFYKPRS